MERNIMNLAKFRALLDHRLGAADEHDTVSVTSERLDILVQLRSPDTDGNRGRRALIGRRQMNWLGTTVNRKLKVHTTSVSRLFANLMNFRYAIESVHEQGWHIIVTNRPYKLNRDKLTVLVAGQAIGSSVGTVQEHKGSQNRVAGSNTNTSTNQQNVGVFLIIKGKAIRSVDVDLETAWPLLRGLDLSGQLVELISPSKHSHSTNVNTGARVQGR